MDAAGNLFIADVGNNSVREVLKTTGDIITVAGNGTEGSSGEGGPATSSELSHPQAVAVDAAGNLFIADVGNDRVSEVVHATGDIISLVTGQVNDLVVDAAGNLFMSNGGGVSERLAATGTYVSATAYLYFPNGLALDAAGDLFIADTFDAEVREVTPAAGVALKLATSTAVTASAGTVVNGQSDTFTATVSTSTQSSEVPTGGTVSFLEVGAVVGTAPLVNGVATLSGIVLNLGSHAITASYSGDASFYPSDSTAPAGVTVTSPTVTAILASAATVNFGQSLTFTATVSELAPGAAVPTGGTVTFSDQGTVIGTSLLENGVATLASTTLAPGSHTITASYSGDGLVFGPSTSGTIATAALQVGGFNEGVAVDSSGNVYFDNNGYDNAGTVDELVKATGQVITVGDNISYGGLAVDAAGDLYGIADFIVTEFVRATGQVKVVAGNVNDPGPGDTGDGGPATEATLDYPRDLAVDAAGNLYIYEGSSGLVREVVKSTGIIETVSGPLPVALGGAVDSAGDYFYASVFDRMVTEVVKATGQTIVVAGTGSADYNGDGEPATDAGFYGDMVAMDAAGDLYIADYGNARVREITPAAIVSVIQTQHLNGVSGTSTYGGTATLTATLTSGSEPEAGESVDFTVTVNGRVMSVGSATTDSNGLATLTGVADSTLNAGTYLGAVGASVAGSSTATPAIGSGDLTISPASSIVSIVSSASPSVLKQAVSFTVDVSAAAPGSGTPTGAVQFVLDGRNFGPAVALVNGAASSGSSSALALGNHVVTVIYNGDGNFTSGTGSFTQSVQKISTTTGLRDSVDPSVFGQSVTFTATVAAMAPGSGVPAGSVSFLSGSTTLATVGLSAGTAVYTTTKLPAGADAITALYNGNASYATSVSAGLNQTVSQDAAFSTVTSSANPSVFGQTVTLTAKVTALSPGSGTPSGSVTFYDGSTALGSVTLNSNGKAIYQTSLLSAGAHSITVSYSGDTSFLSGTSAPLAQHVNQDATRTHLTSSSSPSTNGQAVTFTATVSAGSPGSSTPTGSVEFYDGSTDLGAAISSGAGSWTFTTSGLSIGVHAIQADYLGDTNFKTSTSGVLKQVVKAGNAASALQSAAVAVDLVLDPLADEADQGSLIETLALEQLAAQGNTQWKGIG